jgi:hypothetical protein
MTLRIPRLILFDWDNKLKSAAMTVCISRLHHTGTTNYKICFIFLAKYKKIKYTNGSCIWKDGRVAEGARLESVFRCKLNEGSNPSSSILLKVSFIHL